jgi:uncharacterized membrane protein
MKRFWLLLALFLAVLASEAQGAVIRGSVYGPELNLLTLAIVEVNTTPNQVMVSRNGSYEFMVSPGTYAVTAHQKKLEFVARENITITQEGTYVVDLILFPDLSVEEGLLNETLDIPEYEEQPGRTPSQMFALIVFVVIAGIALWWYARKRKSPEEPGQEKKLAPKADLEEILAFVRKEGGRTTQKELRKAIPYSEAKISLMIAELEAQGKLKKIKKGRGNIIVLA